MQNTVLKELTISIPLLLQEYNSTILHCDLKGFASLSFSFEFKTY